MNRLAIAMVVTACSATVATAGDWGYRGGYRYGPEHRSYSPPYVTSVYESRPYTTSVYVTEDYPWHDEGYYGHARSYAPRHYSGRYDGGYDRDGYRYYGRRYYRDSNGGYRYYTSRRTCVEYPYGEPIVVFCD